MSDGISIPVVRDRRLKVHRHHPHYILKRIVSEKAKLNEKELPVLAVKPRRSGRGCKAAFFLTEVGPPLQRIGRKAWRDLWRMTMMRPAKDR